VGSPVDDDLGAEDVPVSVHDLVEDRNYRQFDHGKAGRLAAKHGALLRAGAGGAGWRRHNRPSSRRQGPDLTARRKRPRKHIGGYCLIDCEE
jgi:hypothetical protein